uniref:Retrovirus-related Pol polyprotein from transposon TNT 1-94-like beta-barrel domain-containing protein n=1 Tax=Fagus sylvatica TaxID=28930 RepID=A0A2N9GH12_FAGSY
MQIEDYLYGKKLYLPLLGKKLDKMEDAEWALLDRQVLGVIRLTLSKSVAHNVVKETTTVGLMTALSGMYEKPSTNNKVHLMKKLFNLKMAESATVAKHLNEFNTITNQLSSVEIEFDDEIRALIVLASLPNSWEAMRMAVNNSAGKDKLKYENIRDLILSEEVRRRDACIDNAKGQAFVTENRDKDHKHDDEKGTTVVVDDEKVVVLSVQEQKCEHVDNIDDEWVVNSAATHHVVRSKELFTTYKAGDFGTVKMGNTSYSKIVGIGDVCIKNNVGFTVMLKNANGRWKLAKGPMVVARGRICCGLYRTRVKACKKKCNAVGTIEKTPQSRVKVNCVTPKRVKFSLPDSATDGGAICDDDEVNDFKDLEQGERAPTLEMVEPHEKRSTGECRKDNFKNIWSSDEGEPENWIKNIQGEINSLGMKGIGIDMIFSLLVKMLKKLDLHASPTCMDSN